MKALLAGEAYSTQQELETGVEGSIREVFENAFMNVMEQ